MTGWVVIQERHSDSPVEFYLDWESYVDGFGNLDGSFWIGLRLMSRLTNKCDSALRVDLVSMDGMLVYADYQQFKVEDQETNFKLLIGGYSSASTVEDSMSTHNGQPFSTQDNDLSDCAVEYHGGWWYTYITCTGANLNARMETGHPQTQTAH